MTTQNMFGVVLWSDANAQKAVIWCEDQGELAYYTPCEGNLHDAPALDAGDLIQFDVVMQKNMRRAKNPQLLEPSHSPNLPSRLRATRETAQLVAKEDSPKVVDLAQYLEPVRDTRILRSG
ncbi:hypothetical protein [Marivita hallyeonensis]|uniref:Cold shock protein, CspA family n=1 Tax=Marivita hallyeonensis TaxID=996342 RepID=A0A1M5RAT9_9RHOB|nr:hypothetical protein [Marivita hallyeonensis]SHH23425.1 hypothetical protein SAMN05443551_1685 [Marivita hallyeonensis]